MFDLVSKYFRAFSDKVILLELRLDAFVIFILPKLLTFFLNLILHNDFIFYLFSCHFYPFDPFAYEFSKSKIMVLFWTLGLYGGWIREKRQGLLKSIDNDISDHRTGDMCQEIMLTNTLMKNSSLWSAIMKGLRKYKGLYVGGS